MSDACRPDTFESFVGQDRPKKVLEILCQAAKKKGSCVPHCLLSGPPGVGKTTLARILASEMKSRLVEVVASNLQATEQMARHLTRLKPKDVLFIDEIHGLPRGHTRQANWRYFCFKNDLRGLTLLMTNVLRSSTSHSNSSPFCILIESAMGAGKFR